MPDAINEPRETFYLATPASGSGPGVLVLHAWWGLNDDIVAVCNNLASAGFVAFAPSLYPAGAIASTIAEAETLRDAHDADWESVVDIVNTALGQLQGRPDVTGRRTGVVGFSLGAWWALNLSQRAVSRIAAVAVYYGNNDGDYGSSRANYLGHFAEDDDFEPLESVRLMESHMQEAGREVDFHIYPDTGHWFAEPGRSDAFVPEAASLAWERTVSFLHAELDDASANDSLPT